MLTSCSGRGIEIERLKKQPLSMVLPPFLASGYAPSKSLHFGWGHARTFAQQCLLEPKRRSIPLVNITSVLAESRQLSGLLNRAQTPRASFSGFKAGGSTKNHRKGDGLDARVTRVPSPPLPTEKPPTPGGSSAMPAQTPDSGGTDFGVEAKNGKGGGVQNCSFLWSFHQGYPQNNANPKLISSGPLETCRLSGSFSQPHISAQQKKTRLQQATPVDEVEG